MKKSFLIIPLIIIAGIFYFIDIDLDNLITANTVKQNVESFVSDNGNIKIFFCPRDDCEIALVNLLDSAEESIDCALYDIGLESVQEKLLEKEKSIQVRIVTDNDNLKKFNYSFVKSDSWGLMHNKFCIIDKKILSTGSMNPTNNGAHKNNNNLLIINSEVLLNNYQAEFDEMWNGTFKKGNKVLNPSISLNNIKIKNFFCPEDCNTKLSSSGSNDKESNAVYKIINLIRGSEHSIYFMTFSFTNDEIGNAILMRNLEGNVTIKGVFEARGMGKESKYEQFKNNGIEVYKDGNSGAMHHKVFIIDNKTVITGSANPTNGGFTKNDENILIIESPDIASEFLKEFEIVYAEATEE